MIITKLIIRMIVMIYLGYQAGKDALTGRVPVIIGDISIAIAFLFFMLSSPTTNEILTTFAVIIFAAIFSSPYLKNHRIFGSGDAKAYVTIYMTSYIAFSTDPLLILALVGFLSCMFFLISIPKLKKEGKVEGNRAPFFPALCKAYATVCISAAAII